MALGNGVSRSESAPEKSTFSNSLKTCGTATILDEPRRALLLLPFDDDDDDGGTSFCCLGGSADGGVSFAQNGDVTPDAAAASCFYYGRGHCNRG